MYSKLLNTTLVPWYSSAYSIHTSAPSMKFSIIILLFRLVVGNPKFALIETEDAPGFDAGLEMPEEPTANKIEPAKSAGADFQSAVG